MRSSTSSFTTGLSNEEKFNERYKTCGWLLCRLVNIDKNVSAVKLLFTRTPSAMPEMEKEQSYLLTLLLHVHDMMHTNHKQPIFHILTIFHQYMTKTEFLLTSQYNIKQTSDRIKKIIFLKGTVTNPAIWLVLYSVSIFLSLPTGHGNAFVSRRVHPNFRCHFS